MKKYRVVEITWNDAYHLTDSWLSNEDIAQAYKEKRYQVVNVGWLIYEDKKNVILASKHSNDYGDWGLIMIIPKGIMVKRRNLRGEVKIKK